MKASILKIEAFSFCKIVISNFRNSQLLWHVIKLLWQLIKIGKTLNGLEVFPLLPSLYYYDI
ncbi:hypothetical protein CLU96_2525 [Chryseobacterium sp. 52]|nr:hypothetical protein CLU96_2525 [Chryseobacterium sp. 52]